jgi:hypothetical protein
MPNKNTDNPFRSMQKSGRSRGPYGRGGYPPAGQAARAGAVSPGFAALAARGANARPGAVSRGLSSLAARGANALAARGANARAGSASSQFAEREARRATEGPEMQARERERAASRTRGPGMNPFMSRMLLQQLGTATAAPELSLDDTPRGSDPPQDSSGVTIVNPKMVVMMIRGPTGAMTPPDTPLKDDEDMDTAPRAYGDAANGARDTSRPYPPTKKKTRDGDA